MKFLVSLLIAFTSFTAELVWLTNMDKAKILATEQKKKILLNFSGSDWCGPCIKLKKTVFAADNFKQHMEKFILVNADFPRLKKNQLAPELKKHNEALAAKYNPKGHFPLTVVIDETGKVLKTWDGFPKDKNAFLKEIEETGK